MWLFANGRHRRGRWKNKSVYSFRAPCTNNAWLYRKVMSQKFCCQLSLTFSPRLCLPYSFNLNVNLKQISLLNDFLISYQSFISFPATRL